MNLLKPNVYQKDVFSINYDNLMKKKINNLFFDIDNTIVSTKENVPSKKIITLFDNLKKDGFNIFIITNALKKRAERFQDILNVKTYYFSLKPLSRNYIKIIKDNGLKIEECAAIGDQIYTDIKGANKLGILSILVDPISKEEFITTKINRIKEKRLFKKTKLLKKGEYYE